MCPKAISYKEWQPIDALLPMHVSLELLKSLEQNPALPSTVPSPCNGVLWHKAMSSVTGSRRHSSRSRTSISSPEKVLVHAVLFDEQRDDWNCCFELLTALLLALKTAERSGSSGTSTTAGGLPPAQAGAETAAVDDAGWTTVRVPHDWAIAGPFEPRGTATGKLPWRGEGWYRKTFTSPPPMRARVYLVFDGVMAIPKVYVNGRRAGGWDYGYMSFRVDATALVKPGGPNVVAVHADTRQHGSRWYPGAGIYRKVSCV